MINETALRQLVDSLVEPQDVGQIIRARPVRGLHVEWAMQLLNEAKKRKQITSRKDPASGYIKYQKIKTGT